jgi:indolepyruvate ferredoxin oxidoreductase
VTARSGIRPTRLRARAPRTGHAQPQPSLTDKYVLEDGNVFMTGVQALVRMTIEQTRLDAAAGLKTGVFISGYPGSPLGGFDLALERAQPFLEPLGITHVPGVNEETAAAAVWGTQMIDLFSGSPYDGVVGIWYGKSPGVDRSLDVLRHANFAGGSRHCALVALAADDPAAKSSTLPNQSEWDFVACAIPVLQPASIGELIEFGLHGVAMSRYAGLWSAMKVTTNLCDGGATLRLGAHIPNVVIPELPGFRKPNNFVLAAPDSLELERHLFEERLPAVAAYARANRLDQVFVQTPLDTIGIVAAGKTYSDLRQAFVDLGLDRRELERLGVRVLKIGLAYPLEPTVVREFAAGLDEIIVVEEKRDLVESQIRNILYSGASRPSVSGKHDARGGQPLFPFHGELDADLIAERLGTRLASLLNAPVTIDRRLRQLEDVKARPIVLSNGRLPNYCPGCPHSRSTVSVDGEVIGGGIGCHGMAVLMSPARRRALYLTPMGAEGAPWIGAASYVDDDHFSQNVGDGTFFHSASQSLRACVAANMNITFKLLYNRHVAMTGGQHPTGASDVASLTRYLEAEGVTRTIVVSEFPESYARRDLAWNARVRDRRHYSEAVRELRSVEGVTVLLFDQQCAAEKRRARKRGAMPAPSRYVFINEEVCEGCGDCGDVSNCMSLQPVETPLGRKTRVQQSSCNADHSCLQGNCPSFLTVYTTEGLRQRALPDLDSDDLPMAKQHTIAGMPYRIFMPGIGGTGVVTSNQLLAHAALIEGKQVHTLDQTGLAQKGGAVLSSLTVYEGPEQPYFANKVGVGQADLVLGFDLMGLSSPANLARMSSERTVVVADASVQATADAVQNVSHQGPDPAHLMSSVGTHTRRDRNQWVDTSSLSEALFREQALANVFMLGIACQSGLLPVSAESVESAIRLNGVSVDQNVQAFRIGRLYIADRSRLDDLVHPPALDPGNPPAALGKEEREYDRLLAECSALSSEGHEMLKYRIAELIAYQDAAYAKSYVSEVVAIHQSESQLPESTEELTQHVIRWLYKLMAYKDEYEVARLLLKAESTGAVKRTFVNPKVKFNLHPPMLRAIGLDRKLELGSWVRPLLGMLVRLRRLRGTALDPFGRTHVRRVERELIEWYRSVLRELGAGVNSTNYELAVQIAAAPDHIRGYEQLKIGTSDATRQRTDELLGRFRATVGGSD